MSNLHGTVTLLYNIYVYNEDTKLEFTSYYFISIKIKYIIYEKLLSLLAIYYEQVNNNILSNNLCTILHHY